MRNHKTGTREEWLADRVELLNAEKELTRKSDELARRRQELPWVRIDKAYRFETEEGSATLADLFRGRSQLLVYHYMFGPDYKAGCATCSTIADGFNGFVVHLANHDVTLMAVSHAPLTKIQPYKRRSAASSTSTSTSRSPKRSSARARSNTTTSAVATRWTWPRSRRWSSTTRTWPEPTWPRIRASGRA